MKNLLWFLAGRHLLGALGDRERVSNEAIRQAQEARKRSDSAAEHVEQLFASYQIYNERIRR